MKKSSFEQNLNKLERLVETLENDTPLEKAIDTFEKGMKLLQNCEQQLSQLKSRVEMLLKKKTP
ncbi:MAG: exodeoxyribonuclease VII small subunit [Deltaproteobacteria bacterium RIFCSPLOWO2_02_FULL_50_16]|nr:MAG: exodeoxyribonuclease VII small subunit [Deltaproteobacteria bacterium RIFCSPHIGHO2_02_FULL_50_15]OGQ57632.1 MAG: exodeoxyribonuclease VII small subunit [Deltaproteobacteria bacterium RIFCSPLOWO2_02_FULL_50_16]OGQ66062.1 MAG: exodeoxyribonuclease VII small subunit [Deltaproteobacteria bacterium RIFCSPLOWO2_12_FULL_50_11]